MIICACIQKSYQRITRILGTQYSMISQRLEYPMSWWTSFHVRGFQVKTILRLFLHVETHLCNILLQKVLWLLKKKVTLNKVPLNVKNKINAVDKHDNYYSRTFIKKILQLWTHWTRFIYPIICIKIIQYYITVIKKH